MNFFEPTSALAFLNSLYVWAIFFVLVGGAFGLVLAAQDWRRSKITFKAIHELETPPSATLVDQEIARLRKEDPNFDLAAFEQRAQALFAQVMEGRQKGELPPRHLVSDGFYRRELAMREIEREHGVRLVHMAVQPIEIRTIGAFHDPFFDSLHVRFYWSSRVTELSTGKNLATTRRPEEQVTTAVWVFVRRPGAKTKNGLPAGGCPNCGAPFSGGATNLCSYCQAIVNSGQYDWVLAQELSFDAYRGPWREFTGLEQMNERDPGFCPEVSEDRAALIFWKWILARTRRDPKQLQRVATKRMLEEMAAEAEAYRQRGERRWIWDVQVDGVDLVLIDHDNDEDQDEVCLRVRWRGRVGDFNEGSRPVVPISSQSTVLTLVRESGVKTDVHTGVSSDRCHKCKAAHGEGDTVKCSYCGAPLEPGKHDFVLNEVQGWETWMTTRRQRAEVAKAVEPYLPSFKFVDERLRLLQMMAAMARADGTVDSSERALLKLCAKRWGVSFRDVAPMLEHDKPPEVDLEPGSWIARSFVEAVIAAAAIDGKIDSKERALIIRLARRLRVDVPSREALAARAEQVLRTRREVEIDS